MTTEWHVDPTLLGQYERGALEPSRVMAVEAHMLACADCRGRIPIDITWMTGNWSIVYDNIHAPEPGPVQRLLTRAGLPEHRIRLLTATPALRWSWLLATLLVLGLAVSASLLTWTGDGTGAGYLFLILAPVLPVIAVSGAYGPSVDPMHEITGTTPTAGPALVLWRAVSVVGVASVTTVIAALLVSGPVWFAAAWLLPALLLCIGSLALATAMPLPAAAGLLGALWCTGVLGVYVTRSEAFVPVMFGPSAQLSYLAAALVATVVLIQRRGRFDLGERR